MHNGIIENYVVAARRAERAGITVTAETDTEVVAHLLGQQV